MISETYHDRSPGKLPGYAQSTAYNTLVRIFCKGLCGAPPMGKAQQTVSWHGTLLSPYLLDIDVSIDLDDQWHWARNVVAEEFA